MEDNKELKILFITDIHQNIEAMRKINFSGYGLVICGGDVIDPNKPDISLAKKIIDMLPEKTYIIPGNCDKDMTLIEHMKSRLNYIHKVLTHFNDIPLLGIGYSRNLSDDMDVYRKYFLEDHRRILDFKKSGGPGFILDFCGIKPEGEKINIINYEDALKNASNFLKRFVSFDEVEIEKLFSGKLSVSRGIVITHSPPFGALDKLPGLPDIGSVSLRAGIEKVKPRLVLCGHFHELFGESRIGNSVVFNPGAVKDHRAGEIIFSKKELKMGFIKL